MMIEGLSFTCDVISGTEHPCSRSACDILNSYYYDCLSRILFPSL